MKKSNLLKTVISVLCICSLLAVNLINGPAFLSEAADAVEQKTPEQLGYERITLNDFGIADGTYPATASETGAAYGSYAGATSLNGKYLDVNIYQDGPVGSEANTRIQYGGGGAGQQWYGLRIVQFWDATNGSRLLFTMAANPNERYELALGDAIDINLKVATNVYSDKVTADVWIDDVRQEQMVFTGACVNEMGNFMGVFVQDKDITVTTPAVTSTPVINNQNTAPTETGYVFAGWYADKACTEPYAEPTADQAVYAKFVPKRVLSVKSQITANLTAESDEGDIRFLTTVDCDDYEKVGFDITIDGFEKQSIVSTSVYEKLYYVNSQTEIDEETTPEKEFSNLSKYFMAYAYWEVPNAYFDTTFTVTPWWVTADGTLVYGDTVTRTVNEGIQLYAQQ